MPSIVASQLKQIFNKNLIFVSKWHVYNNQWRWKFVISVYVISQPIKDIIAKKHDKLNSLMIAQVP